MLGVVTLDAARAPTSPSGRATRAAAALSPPRAAAVLSPRAAALSPQPRRAPVPPLGFRRPPRLPPAAAACDTVTTEERAAAHVRCPRCGAASVVLSLTTARCACWAPLCAPRPLELRASCSACGAELPHEVFTRGRAAAGSAHAPAPAGSSAAAPAPAGSLVAAAPAPAARETVEI